MIAVAALGRLNRRHFGSPWPALRLCMFSRAVFVLGARWNSFRVGVVAGFHFLQCIHPWQLGTELLVERCFLACRFHDALRAGTVRAHSMKCLKHYLTRVNALFSGTSVVSAWHLLDP